MVSLCIFLVTTELEHLCKCLFTLCVASSVKCPVPVFPHFFFYKMHCLFKIDLSAFLFILDASPLSAVVVTTSSSIVMLYFSTFTVSVDEHYVLNFHVSGMSQFFYGLHILRLVLTNPFCVELAVMTGPKEPRAGLAQTAEGSLEGEVLGLSVWLTAGRLIKNRMRQERKTGDRLSALNLILLATIKQSPWTGRGRDCLRTRHRLRERSPSPHLGPTATWLLLLPCQPLLRHFIPSPGG